MTIGFPLLRLQPPTATMFTKQFRREAISEATSWPGDKLTDDFDNEPDATS
jgi:hypothetical protein